MTFHRSRAGAGASLAFFVLAASCGGGEGSRPAASMPAPSASTPAPSASAPVAVTPKFSTRQLDADTPMKSASGATFEAPKGWFVTDKGDVLVLDDPERDLTITLVEVSNEPDTTKAIESAWKKTAPEFRRSVKRTVDLPAKDGWDAITQLMYETGGTEQRTVLGISRRKGSAQYVALVDGKDAGLDRRGAQLMTILSTFKAAGVEEESFKGRNAHAFDQERSKLLESFVERAMTALHVPGAAIAVVQGGKVVYEKGFGVREMGKKEPVTPNTLFMIGSTTKSLTTLMMAKLVDEGKFGWDTPVTQVLPSFALGDAEVTKKTQMKHTVCACAGLPRQDLEFIFEYADVTPEQRVDLMKTMTPTTGFGETFQYSNTMVATGGYASAHAFDAKKKLGPAYDEAMQKLVFDPLGMKSTTMDFRVVKGREHASTHAENLQAQMKTLPLEYEEGVVPIRPAGAAWSNVRDMSKFVQIELAKGRDGKGKVLFSEANLLKRREPQIKITDKMSYGLGLMIENDHDLVVIHHGGNNIGFTSDMFFMPEHDVGVVLLTNAGNTNAFRGTVRRRFIEILFDGKEEAAKTLDFAVAQKQKAVETELKDVTLEPDAEWTKTFVGSYKNANLGSLTVRVDGKKGVIDAGEWKSAFGKETSADGIVKLVLLEAPLDGLTFLPGEKSGKKTLTIELPQQTYVFEKESSGGVASGK